MTMIYQAYINYLLLLSFILKKSAVLQLVLDHIHAHLQIPLGHV